MTERSHGWNTWKREKMFIKPPQGATDYEGGVFQADCGVCAATLRGLMNIPIRSPRVRTRGYVPTPSARAERQNKLQYSPGEAG